MNSSFVPNKSAHDPQQRKQEIKEWLLNSGREVIWDSIALDPLETIHSYTKDDLERWYGGPKGVGFYNYLHPPITPTEGKVTFLPSLILDKVP